MSQIINDYLQYLEFKELYDKTIYEMQFLTEAEDKKKIKIFKKMTSYAEKGLATYKINTSFVTNFSKKFKNTIEDSYNKGIPAEKASKGLINELFNKLKTKILNMNLSQKILTAIVVFIIIILLNSFIMNVGASLLVTFGLSIDNAVAIFLPIVGPLFEEAAKNFFIQTKMPWLGTGVVFGLEAFLYLYNFWKLGKIGLKAIIGRAVALFFHFFTTKVQKGYMEKHPDKAFTAYLIGFIIHFVWNAMPTAAIILGGHSISATGLG